MTIPHLTLNKLSVYKLPGFPKGLKDFNGLSAHINIVTGPNGSGKSSTARLIQKLLWRVPAGGTHAGAAFSAGGQSWFAKTDHGQVVMQKDGISADLPGMPGSDIMSRYMLAMHDLVQADEKDLAEEILKMAIGGFDLDGARRQLGYGPGIRSKTINEYRDFHEARKSLDEITRGQKDLKNQQEQLTTLKEQRAAAEAAGKRMGFFQIYRDYLTARQRENSCKDEMAVYPDAMHNTRPDDFDAISKMEEQVADLHGKLAKASGHIETASNSIEMLGLPADGLKQEVLAELRIDVDRLTTLEQESDRLRGEMQAADESARQALKGISDHADVNAWKDISLDDVGALDEFLLTAQKALGDQQLNRQKALRLENERNTIPVYDAEQLREGRRLLALWLREKKSYYGISVHWVVVIIISAMLTALASWHFGVIGLAGLAIVATAAIMAFMSRPGGDMLSCQNSYLQTGNDLPERWEPEAVASMLDQLTEKLAACRRREQLLHDHTLLQEELASIETTMQSLAGQHAAWQQKLHVVPGMPTGNLSHHTAMYHFLNRLKEWQRHYLLARGTEAKIGEISMLADSLLMKINHHFEGVGVKTVDSVARAKAVLESLVEKEQKRKEWLNQIRVMEVTLEETERQKEHTVNELQSVYARLKIDIGDKESVRLLVGQIHGFQKCKEELAIASRSASEYKVRLEEHPLWDETGQGREVPGSDDLDRLIRENGDLFEKRDQLNAGITRVETLVHAATYGHSLEQALLKMDEASEKLAVVFETNLSSMTGDILCHALKDEMSSKTMPEVFNRARSLFNRITQGRYELIINDQNGAAFAARDSVLGEGLALNELSTGTRIQLLIAVRLAYIETRESGLRLPVLADELLANSDDIRAKAIMEALIAISREGRQVFYFSAQHDEVLKWQGVLQNHPDIDHRLFSLADDAETLSGQGEQPTLNEQVEFIDTVPAPGALSHAAYRELLHVPGFDPSSDPVESLHLWYLLEDPVTLYHCLKFRIRYWGQLRGFSREGGKVEGLDQAAMERLSRLAGLTSRYCELYQVGRPKRIDRQVLINSGAVTPAFIDQVNEQLFEVNGNPEALLNQIRNGAISGFRRAALDNLEQYLENEGYITELSPLNSDDIMVHLQAYISHQDIDPADAQNLMHRILK